MSMVQRACRNAVLLLAVLASGPAAAQVESPAGPVPPELLAARREALLARLGTGVAVVTSAQPRSIEGDYPQDSDYRENNDFFYLTGLEAPGATLVLRARDGAPDSVVLYLPVRDPATERWTGARLGPGDEARRLTGIADVRPATARDADLHRWLAAGTPALFVEVPMRERGACRGDPTARPACAPLLAGLALPASVTVGSVSAPIEALRLVKDADELRRLREAIRITTEAHRAAAAALEAGMWEYELEAIVEYTFRRHGAERVGFPSIVGSGPLATVLHYDRSRRQMQAGDLVVVDIGAEYGYYSADVTRTWPVSGRFTDRQRALYELVLATQQAAIDSVRPGITVARLNEIARAHMRAHSGDLCAPGTCETYFVHGLAHWLGMDVHDVGDYSTPLAAGMVLTIEPGLYIPEEEIGIRIEDDVLVTAGGHELLSGHAPRAPAEVERLMADTRAARALQR